VNLAAALAALNERVLMIDLDPQGNATMGSGVNKNDLPVSSYHWLMAEASFAEAAQASPASYQVMPSNIDLTAAEVALLQHNEREFVMRDLLRANAADFDYVLIDCPPSLNILTVNALVAATSVLIPMQCEYYALEGLSALLDTVDGICEKANPNLQIEGLLRTMYDPRNG